MALYNFYLHFKMKGVLEKLHLQSVTRKEQYNNYIVSIKVDTGHNKSFQERI